MCQGNKKIIYGGGGFRKIYSIACRKNILNDNLVGGYELLVVYKVSLGGPLCGGGGGG